MAKGSAPVPESSGIDWSTFGAGAGTGIAVLLGAGVVVGLTRRHRTLASA